MIPMFFRINSWFYMLCLLIHDERSFEMFVPLLILLVMDPSVI